MTKGEFTAAKAIAELKRNITDLFENMRVLERNSQDYGGEIHNQIEDCLHDLWMITSLVETVHDNRILMCANWILNYMHDGEFYKRNGIIDAAEREGKYHCGQANRALHALELSGVIGTRKIKGIDAIYIIANRHQYVIFEEDAE